MSTKKAVTAKKPTKVQTKVLTITAEQLAAGLQRFGKVCDFVELHMPQRLEPVEAQARAGGSMPPDAPAPTQIGAEQLAYDVRAFAADLQKQTAAIRARLTNGANKENEASQAVGSSPTRGPIKDALESTTGLFYSIRNDLDMIAQYIGN